MAPFFFLILLSGCASINYWDYRETVLVTSDPPGAKVYDDGKFIGTTPGYLRVRRRRTPMIRVVYNDDQSRFVRLRSSIRWGDSVAANLMFLTLAPFGWIADLSTGTIWQMADPPMLTFKGKGSPPNIQKIAVAPPESADFDLGDAVGRVITDNLAAKTKYSVLPYDKTTPVFQYYDSGQGLTSRENYRNNLFYELKVDHVLWSKTKVEDHEIFVESELKDIYEQKTVRKYSWQLSPQDEDLQAEYRQKQWFNYFHFLPNTMFLTYASYQPEIEIDGTLRKGTEGKAVTTWEHIARYVSMIGLSRQERPRFNVRGHWMFDFVPWFVISTKNIAYPDVPSISDAQFSRWYISGGYGLEVGYQSRYGFLYLDLVPALTWTHLDYETPFVRGTVARTSITTTAEVGYSYFFSDHIIGRIFVRNMAEDKKLWSDALTEINGTPTYTSTVNSAFTGISIGYYFPPSLKSASSSWKVK